MKFFFWFFLALLILCGAFWIFDKPGSGMWIPTLVFLVLDVCVLLYNLVRNGSIWDDNSQGK